MVVTGEQTYRFMKLSQDLHTIELVSQELAAAAPDGHEVSRHYTTHTWTKDQMLLLVCTAEGDMLLCGQQGEFLRWLEDSPYGVAIHTMYSFSRGLIVAGAGGCIWAFEGSTDEARPYKLQQPMICSEDRDRSLADNFDPENLDIVSLVLNATEDMLFYIDRSNQLLKYAIQLDGTDIESTKSDYVHSPFHMNEITGMDICLRKQLIVTCSKRFINVWNYAERRLEISHAVPIGDEPQAVAFHPSGFHIVVAIGDNIQLMNVLSTSIKAYNSF